MAIITISRQVAALGDEISTALAQRLGYNFINRKQMEQKIVELGFDEKKLPKYDEKKPGFFASLTKDRDEYLNYLQQAMLESARSGNCILIGRGSYIILNELPNLVPVRLIADDATRIRRLQEEFNWTEKQARARITESDTNRRGFHKSFFNVDNTDQENFALTMNTSFLNVEQAVDVIQALVQSVVTPNKEAESSKKIEYLIQAQKLVNRLLFEYHLNINFLHASVNSDGTLYTLQGVADSQAVVQRALELCKTLAPEIQVKSAVTIVQDFKN